MRKNVLLTATILALFFTSSFTGEGEDDKKDKKQANTSLNNKIKNVALQTDTNPTNGSIGNEPEAGVAIGTAKPKTVDQRFVDVIKENSRGKHQFN